ncbi:uncharacterized protein VTP21DRAFT_9076 [Calcarisporiella thermophila]|uniref:uncharacterized protein n=1 Tax=Calcarisporiella thermophila TaxID=911321 RepID=UPI0037448232
MPLPGIEPGSSRPQRDSSTRPPIKRSYKLKGALIFNITGIADHNQATSAIKESFVDIINAINDNLRRDMIEFAIQFKEHVDTDKIISEGLVVNKRCVPIHRSFDLSSAALTIRMDDIRLSYNHAQDAESYKAWVEENFAPVLHWEFGKHPSFPTVIRPTLFMTLNVTGRRDEHYYGPTKNPPTNNGNPLVFGASSTDKSQTDADGFTLVTRRKGKRSKAGKKDQTQPEQENPSTSASTPRPLKRQLRDFLPSPTTQSTNSEYNQVQQDILKESELKETQPTQYEHLNNTHQEDNQYSPETDLDDPKTTHGDLGTTHGDTDTMHDDSA